MRTDNSSLFFQSQAIRLSDTVHMKTGQDCCSACPVFNRMKKLSVLKLPDKMDQ